MARLVVGVAEMAVSNSPGDEIVTHALGSCIGVAIYDSKIHVGGMLHYMLPTSTIDKGKVASNPCMFADTGVPLLLSELGKLGAAEKRRMIVKVAGGAQIMDERGVFNVGRRNHIALRQIFWQTGILIDAEDVGGMKARTMSLDMASGTVVVSSNGQKVQL